LEKPINTVASSEKPEEKKRKARNMRQIHVYNIDLTRIDGSGDFPCPRCGTNISPNDNTEKAYSILEPKVNNQGLEEIVIQCIKCGSFIHLTGFSLLQDLSGTNRKETTPAQTEETPSTSLTYSFNFQLINTRNFKPQPPRRLSISKPSCSMLRFK
jgi:predicted RNA-binding Zn-ribbon protein involved in translation (DUF1610 family)